MTDNKTFPLPESSPNPSDLVTSTVKPVAASSRRPRKPAATFRLIPASTHQALIHIKESLQLDLGEVARFFLEYSLQHYQNKTLILEPQLVSGHRSLYGLPAVDKPGQRPARESAALKKPRTYHGIPAATSQALKEIAEEWSIPVGEVARCFFEYALQAYQQGKIELEIVETRRFPTLFPQDYTPE